MAETRESLEQLSTEELRERAFSLAERRLDVGFFWDLVKHLPATQRLSVEDSFTAASATVSDLVELLRELRGEHLGDAEPLLRAKFIDYVEQHQK